MSQRIRILSPKNKKPKGILISKRSIGTMWVNGRPYSYNLNLMDSCNWETNKKSHKKPIRVWRKR